MKAEYSMLSLLIPGPQSPGNNIDVYLQPLIEELKVLWDLGVETCDASVKQTFQMRASLLWTISDFPGYAMLSGWSTKGKLACPGCNYNTNSTYLKHSRKMCYMGHRAFLPMDHKYRSNARDFNGRTENRPPPELLKGEDIFDLLEGFNNAFGKTKDYEKARLDLQDMGIRKKLHPKELDQGKKIVFAKACFSMTTKEKTTFCYVLKKAKIPDGCASNISKCVQLAERKVSGYKSHDAHFMLHYLLQVAVRSAMSNQVAHPLIRLCSFFRCLCQKVIEVADLDILQTEIVETLCRLETIFPPSFFDIMVHLPIHLVNEVRLGGPVQFRWMYFTERYLGKLKSYVRNKSRPEVQSIAYYGSITEIVEVDYYGMLKFVLFRCDWFEVEEDKFGLTCVYFNKRCYMDDPFVLASQVHQCFYIQDPSNPNRHYVMKSIPREFFNLNEQSTSNGQQPYQCDPSDHPINLAVSDETREVEFDRNDIPPTIIVNSLRGSDEKESDDDSSFDETHLD
ncbi:uncharacterized protein [Cicer arietinum]|uniref:uncharacterized protein n=1 Tax=Cicer arietinum TaxID=3827 RepID=UPI003CC685FF